MVRGDDNWPFTWDVSQTFDLGAKSAHEKWSEKCAQDAVGEVVEHVPNLAAIAPYDTI